MEFSHFYQQKQKNLVEANLKRTLKTPRGIDFCSNDYLSFSENSVLKKAIIDRAFNYPLGSTGSRLLRGHSETTEELETLLSDFCHTEDSLFFSTGYQANLGLFSCLLKEQARVFSDEMIHASIIDGIRLSSCEKYIWSHNDVGELEMLLKQKASDDKLNFIVVESIYSMRGDQAPLVELTKLAEKYGCQLIVDEAHATGLYGHRGSGLIEKLGVREKVFASIHTAGKSLGVSGAWVACSSDLKDHMINYSRPFVYSTAPTHFQQLALIEAIQFLSKNKDMLIEEFFKKLSAFQSQLLSLSEIFSVKLLGVGGPVTALVVSDNQKAVEIMENLSDEGFDVRAIRPPSVPEGEALLRITLPLARSMEEIDCFILALKQSLKAVL